MSQRFRFRMLGAVAVFILALQTAQAGSISLTEGVITVTDQVTPVGSLFQYDYTVSDTTGLLAVLDIAVSPGIAISDISAPGGSAAYETAYDSVLGLVSFLENNAVFPSSPEPGFMFDSPVGPGDSTFGVTLYDGTTGTGSVTGPVTPEPASLTLFGLGGAVLLAGRKRWFAFAHYKVSSKVSEGAK